MADISQQLANLCEQMNTSNLNQTKLLESMESVQCKLDTLTKESQRHDETLKILREENHFLRREIELLKKAQNKQIEADRNNEFMIRGIPPMKNEYLIGIFCKIMTALQLEIPEVAVDSIFRPQTKDKIIVKLIRRIDKETIIKRAKQIRLKGKDIGIDSNPDVNIYINESLSPQVAKLFYEARKIRTDFGIKFVWHKEGKIWMKKNETDAPLRVTSLEEITELRNHLLANAKQPEASQEHQPSGSKRDELSILHPRELTDEGDPTQAMEIQVTVDSSDELHSPHTSSDELHSSLPSTSSFIKSWATGIKRPPRAAKLTDKMNRNKINNGINRTTPY